jgi:hypothetical protein
MSRLPTHRDNAEVPGHLITKEDARSFADGIRERDIRRQLLLEGKKIFSGSLNQAPELKAANTAAGTPSRIPKTTARTFSRSQSPPMEQRHYGQPTCWHCGSTRHFLKHCPRKSNKEDNDRRWIREDRGPENEREPTRRDDGQAGT